MLLALLIVIGTLLLLVATVVFHRMLQVREAARRLAMREVLKAVEEHKAAVERGEAVVARLEASRPATSPEPRR